MGLYLNDNGYINYIRSGYNISSTHGNGNEELHKSEIEQICNEIVNQKIKALTYEINNTLESIINQKIKSIVNGVFQGLKRDVKVSASVSLDTAGEIYKREEVKQIISNEILKQILTELNKDYSINLSHR